MADDVVITGDDEVAVSANLDLGTIRSRAIYRYGADLGQALWDQWINEGYVDFCERTGCLQSSGYLATTAGSREVALPSGTLRIVGVKYKGVPLLETTPQRLDQEEGANWEAATGTPTRWFAEGLEHFCLYPIPAESGTTDLFQRHVETPTTELSADTDEPRIPLGYRQALVYFACLAAAEYDSDVDASGKRAAQFGAAYERMVRRCRSAMEMVGNMPPRILSARSNYRGQG